MSSANPELLPKPNMLSDVKSAKVVAPEPNEPIAVTGKRYRVLSAPGMLPKPIPPRAGDMGARIVVGVTTNGSRPVVTNDPLKLKTTFPPSWVAMATTAADELVIETAVNRIVAESTNE